MESQKDLQIGCRYCMGAGVVGGGGDRRDVMVS